MNSESEAPGPVSAETRVARLNQLYAVSSGINEAILRISDERSLYEQVCRIAVEKGGLRMAWVGLIGPDNDHFEAMAFCGENAGYLDSVKVSSIEEKLSGKGPGGQAFRTGLPALCNDIARDRELFASRTEALERGYRSCAAFPLRLGELSVGVFVVYSGQVGYFDAEEVALLNALAANMSFLLESLDKERQRKRAESALRASEQQFASAFANAAIGIALVAPEGRFLKTNRSLCQMLGYTEEELLEKTFLEITHPEDLEGDLGLVRQLLTGELETYQLEKRYFHRDGHIVWALLSVSLVGDEEGRPVHFISQIQDVSQERQAREALLLSEERFRLVSKATNDAIWDWDAQTNQLWWNEGFEHLFGFDRQEVESSLDSWSSRVHPEDRERVLTNFHQTAERSETAFTDEYRFLCKDGSYAHVLDRGHVIRNDGGQVLRMIGCMTDLTERIRAAERIAEQAALIDQTHDAILVRDLDRRIIFWSKGAERLYGWSAEEAAGTEFNEILQVDLDKFQQAEQSVMRHGEWNGQMQKAAKSGAVLTLDCRWTLLRDAQRHPKSILMIDTDITERKKLEQQFLRAQRMESIGTLAGGIAHDLNNVLAPIMMSIDLLKMGEENPTRQGILAAIANSAKRGADMVQQVLSFARGIDGQRLDVPMDRLLLDLVKIVNDTFLKNVKVLTQIPTDLWSVSGDGTQLHQVLLNLCVNARDAMPGGGTLTISAENRFLDEQYAAINIDAKSGAYVIIQVEDTGTGMPPEVIEKIFDPFFTTKELGKGTGLGLSTSMAIIKSHGGFIRVYSEPGKGSRFRIYLPAQLQAARNAAIDCAMEEVPRGRGELILVVDDETSVRQITGQTLEAFGYRVLLAADGTEAVAIYAGQRDEIAVVLTDMMMPVMDGPTTIQVLLKMNSKARVIAASGLNANALVTKAFNIGIKHFIAKPYTAETLLRTLHEVLAADAR